VRERTAAGFILARVVDGTPLYLLLQSAEHGDWLPPKGHTDAGEDALATALRETAEEAGITDVRLVRDFVRDAVYEVTTARRGSYRKRVTWLLGTTGTTEIARSAEHKAAGWFPLREALSLVAHEQVREILREADARLNS